MSDLTTPGRNLGGDVSADWDLKARNELIPRPGVKPTESYSNSAKHMTLRLLRQALNDSADEPITDASESGVQI